MSKKQCDGGYGDKGGRRLFSITELPSQYGGRLWWWRCRVWNGDLPVIRFGRKCMVDARDIERLLETGKQVAV